MDVIALGELLIDFTPAGFSPAGRRLFEQNPGGAPANVLVAVSRLGGSTGFIGKVGDDRFGWALQQELSRNGVDTAGLVCSDKVNTTLAFVHLDADGDRSFSFYRKPGADIMLRADEINFSLIDDATVFHFGSLSLTNEPARTATIEAAEYAKRNGKIVSYDPNWRPPLWESDTAAREGMLLGLEYAEVIKVSEEELSFLTGSEDIAEGTRMLLKDGVSLVVVTLGSKGCYYLGRSGFGYVPGFGVNVVDTTGAGDGFVGALLYSISRLNCSLDRLSRELLEEILQFCNVVGALATTKNGGIPAMPRIKEVREFLGSR